MRQTCSCSLIGIKQIEPGSDLYYSRIKTSFEFDLLILSVHHCGNKTSQKPHYT